ncbi:Uncharacterised protein [Klebsiella pneumoniae subsp. ozaenae]|uniref:Uncharacterized protein n=1 Tax=Klebsiella pneumoniae subsp. ozaenae TaxID=574 RepID=A0A377Z1W8_KLEPO|nr:Uncharacterised protein [Klebsiella pneumoniae subsp. ozaenae]
MVIDEARRGSKKRQALVPQHAVKGVHNDLQRLGERLIVLAFGFIPAVPDLADNPPAGSAYLARSGTEEALDTVLVIGLRQPFNQARPDRLKRYE